MNLKKILIISITVVIFAVSAIFWGPIAYSHVTKNVNYYIKKSDKATSQHKIQNGIKYLNTAAKINPLNPIVFYKRAQLYNRRGGQNKALDDISEAIAIAPDNIDYLYFRGDLMNSTGHYNGALADFNRILEINPNYLIAYIGRGIAYYNMGNKEQAKKNFLKAKELGYAVPTQWLKYANNEPVIKPMTTKAKTKVSSKSKSAKKTAKKK